MDLVTSGAVWRKDCSSTISTGLRVDIILILWYASGQKEHQWVRCPAISSYIFAEGKNKTNVRLLSHVLSEVSGLCGTTRLAYILPV